MAFMKYARAHTVTPDVGRKGWQKVRVASHMEPSGKLLDAASDILGEQFDPKNYLLSHCTLVASVDTYAPEGVRLGHVQDGSSRIYRKFAEYRVTPDTEALINNNFDAFDRQVLLKSYRTLIGAENYQEHVQVPELSKGKIIDAVARDLGHSIYVDVLVATHRKHKQLVADILSGKMAAMSMGCSVEGCICTKCGNWAADETEACVHIKHEKGNSFFDSNGQKHRVAELCGHPTIDPTGGVNFIEGSWVQSPAFLGAAFRNVLSPTEDMVRQAQAVLSQPPKEWTADARRKAAFSIHVGTGTATEGRTVATLPSSSAHVGPVDLSRATRMFLAGWDDEEDTSEEGAAPAEDTDDLQKMEDDLAKHVRDRVKNKLKEDMRQRDLGEKTEDTPMDPNDSVQREASIKSAAVHTLLRIARSDVEFVDGLARLDKAGGNTINVALYRAALAAGPCGEGPRQYLSKCASFLGDKHMSEVESRQLLRIGQLLAQRETFPRG